MARSRRPGSSKTWSQLSPAYRKALVAKGITRREWLAGADLRAARRHPPRRPPGAAPADVTQRVIRGEGTTADLATLNAWARDNRDRYGFAMSADTAAALSQIPFPPSRWEHVHFTPADDGRPWTMTVTPVRGYPVTIQIPGGGAKDTSGASEVLDMLTAEEIDFDVEGS